MKWDLDLRITFSGKVARRGAKTQFPEAVLKAANTGRIGSRKVRRDQQFIY